MYTLLPVTNKLFIKVIKYDCTLKDVTQICFLFHIRMPQILMLKPRTMNLSIKVNNHVHQDLQLSIEFSEKEHSNIAL